MTQEELTAQFERLEQRLTQSMVDAIGRAVESAIRTAAQTERDRMQHMIDATIEAKVLSTRCDCPLEQGEDKHIRHLMGMLSDLGCGDQSCGVREMRENHVWTTKLRRKSEKVGTYAVLVAVGLIVTGAIAAFVAGVKTHVGGQ